MSGGDNVRFPFSTTQGGAITAVTDSVVARELLSTDIYLPIDRHFLLFCLLFPRLTRAAAVLTTSLLSLPLPRITPPVFLSPSVCCSVPT